MATDSVRFKGSAETTFEGYPDRLRHLILETYPKLDVHALIYPTYETRGSLREAVDALVGWLTIKVAEYESELQRKYSVALCGHSMGGIVCLDSALAIRRSAPGGKMPWPSVCGVLAYDTPFLGLHPHVFKHQLSTYHGYLDSAMKVGSVLAPVTGGLATMWNARTTNTTSSHSFSRLSTASWIGIGTAAAAAIGAATTAAITRSDPFQDSYRWVSEHITFVKHLWDGEALSSRMSDCDVPFHCFYTTLAGEDARPFILPPPSKASYAKHFSPLELHARDEVTAHISMFSLTTNSSYLTMGLESASHLTEWIPHMGAQCGKSDSRVHVSERLEE